jgi:Tfp pilus assembly protein PilN
MNSVNLLPDRAGRQRSLRGGGGGGGAKRPAVVLGAVCVVGALGFWAHGVRSEVSSLRSDVETATAERAALTAQLGTRLAGEKRAQLVVVRRGAVIALATGRINWERLVRDTAQVLPEGVWLSQINGEVAVQAAIGAAPTTPGPTAPPKGLHLEGFALTHTQVALLLTRLAAVPGLGEPRLLSSEAIQRGGRTVQQFIIDSPVDQRAQDRPTLSVVGTSQAVDAGTASGGFVP